MRKFCLEWEVNLELFSLNFHVKHRLFRHTNQLEFKMMKVKLQRKIKTSIS